jgi:sirohydrochlorin cobaltochelatase
MNKDNALVLFAHGARDQRWAHPFQRLKTMTQSKLSDTRVELAFLELMEPKLIDLIDELVHSEVTKVTVVPIFLGQGGHILRDLPLIMAELREKYPQLSLSQVEAVGENADVLNAISEYCVGSLN